MPRPVYTRSRRRQTVTICIVKNSPRLRLVWKNFAGMMLSSHRHIIISLLLYQWITYGEEKGKGRTFYWTRCGRFCTTVSGVSQSRHLQLFTAQFRGDSGCLKEEEGRRLKTKWEQILTYFPSAKIHLITYWLASRRDFVSFLGLVWLAVVSVTREHIQSYSKCV